MFKLIYVSQGVKDQSSSKGATSAVNVRVHQQPSSSEFRVSSSEFPQRSVEGVTKRRRRKTARRSNTQKPNGAISIGANPHVLLRKLVQRSLVSRKNHQFQGLNFRPGILKSLERELLKHKGCFFGLDGFKIPSLFVVPRGPGIGFGDGPFPEMGLRSRGACTGFGILLVSPEATRLTLKAILRGEKR